MVPLERPVTVIGEEPAELVCPPLEVTVYEEIEAPPLDTGAENVIVACPLPAVAVPIDGASGTVDGVTELLALESVLVPLALVARTLKVYAVPLVRPEMVIGEEPPLALKPPVLE